VDGEETRKHSKEIRKNLPGDKTVIRCCFCACFVSVGSGTATMTVVWVGVHGNFFAKRVWMDVKGKG
jgi:hypothetical protein